MPVYSMTGYVSTSTDVQDKAGLLAGVLGIEIRTVNSRFLDLSFRLPDAMRDQEPSARQRLGRHIKRGKVELRAQVQPATNGQAAQIATTQLDRLTRLQQTIQKRLPTAEPLSVAEIIQLTDTSQDQDMAPFSAAFPTLLDGAIETLLQTRESEGTRLQALISDRTQRLQQLATQARPLVPQVVQARKQAFLQRWRSILDLAEPALQDVPMQERALAEAAAFAMKIDVTEELDRLQAHLDEIDKVLARGGTIGKRLDFLVQELHREANTLGSKSSALELSRIGVDMKILIEQIREQVQNLE